MKSNQNSSHYFRTEIPNILYGLLNPYQLALYFAYKKSAGDNGKCTKSLNTLAKETKISKRMIIKTRDELAQVHPILKKPLIKIIKRISEHGDKDTNEVSVIDLWEDNLNEFNNKKYSGGGSAPHALPSAPDTLGVVHTVHEGSACGAHKEEPFKKNPSKKQQQEQDLLLSFSEKEKKEFEKMLQTLEEIKKNIEPCKKEKENLDFTMDFLRNLCLKHTVKIVRLQLNQYILQYVDGNGILKNSKEGLLKHACEKQYRKPK